MKKPLQDILVGRSSSLLRSDAGIAMVQIAVLVGMMSTIALVIASLSSSGVQGLKHMRIANDIEAVETLIKLTLTRPQTTQEVTNKIRVCPSTLPDLQTYSYNGSAYPLSPGSLKVLDSDGNSVLKSLNDLQGKNINATDYEIKARLVPPDPKVVPINPVSFPYPDDTGVKKNFRLWITKLMIFGEKKSTDSQGGAILHGEVPLGLITDPVSGKLFDCLVDPSDFERVCKMLGGKYNAQMDPQCLLTKVAVSSDTLPLTAWDKIPDANGFRDGDVFTENIVMAGNQSRIDISRKNWALAKGFIFGGSKSNGVGFGQNGNGAVGMGVDYQGTGFFSLFTETQVALNNYPGGWAGIRTYGNRPYVFSNVFPASGPNVSSDHMVMDPARKLLIHDGTVVASKPSNVTAYLNGTDSIKFFDKVGFASNYDSGIMATLGGVDANGDNNVEDAGLWIRQSGATVAAIYFTKIYSEPDSSFGAFVFKHFRGGDLAFVNNEILATKCCTPMLIKGNAANRGNVGFGENTNPSARLHVYAPSTLALRLEGTANFEGAMTVNGNVNILRDTLVTRDVYGSSTVSAASDIRLKTDIRPIESALEKILKINGVYFRWKDPARSQNRQIGLIAQNVEEVFPELVVTDKNGIKAVAYQNLVGPMIEALREQDQQVRSLQKSSVEMASRFNKILRKVCKDDPSDKLCAKNP